MATNVAETSLTIPGIRCAASSGGPVCGDALVAETQQIVQAFSSGPHIFNLGHGITPDADPDNVQRMIDAVRDQ